MWNTMINMGDGVESQVNGRDQILNKITELPQTRKDVSLQIQEDYRTQNRKDQKRKSL